MREMMRNKGWDAVIIGSSDPHSSEYPADRWKQVEWISGFTGEAGDIVVTLDHAGLWSDTRYFIQAVQQLEGSGIVLHKTRVPEQVLIPEWLRNELGTSAVVAVDGWCMSAQSVRELNLEVVSVPDMLSVMWKDRPGIPQTPLFEIEAGESRQSKIEWLRSFLESEQCDGMLVCALDEIAWTLNLRASDIDYNPFFISYLLVGSSDIKLFIKKDQDYDPESLKLFDKLENEGINVLMYNEIDYMTSEFGTCLYIDPSKLNYELYSRLEMPVKEGTSPIELRKAVKTESEIEAIRNAHIKDGVAMEKYLYWLEKSLQADRAVSEWDAAVRLAQFRANADEYVGDSFETISAYAAGAALPHYMTPRPDAPLLQEEGLYLCDSGAHYYGEDICGTTDITRTLPLGECSPLEKEDYTLVLKGHIDLAMAVFPKGTAGCQIDALAREPLWKAMRNFGHGTGHGVGCFLGCHEGPHSIRQNFNSTALQAGMLVSNEPGIYREGMHGIRHENILLCVEAGSNEFGDWLAFDTISLCHFDTSAIVRGMLNREELQWLNEYNDRVYKMLSPYLSEAESEWLRGKTQAVSL